MKKKTILKFQSVTCKLLSAIFLSVCIVFSICVYYSFAEVPCKINYQGRLIKDNVPVHNTAGIPMIFTLYDELIGITGEKVVYTGNVPVYNGLFRVVLDLQDVDWTAGEAKYLQVIVDEEPLSPREEIYAYPYAINSHLLEGETKDYFINTSGEEQTKRGDLKIEGILDIDAPDTDIDALKVHSGDTYGLYVSTGGNVGIGTTSPQAKLHIGGTTGVDGIRFPDNTLMTTAAGIGTVANVVMVQTRQQATYSVPTSGNGTVITPLNLVITPKKAGNRIILEWIVNGETVNNVVYIVTRNGIRLADTTNANNNRWAGITAQPYDPDHNSTPANAVVKIIDMNSLDVTTTYELRVRSSDSAALTLYLNRTIGSAGKDVYEACLSVGTATEIWW